MAHANPKHSSSQPNPISNEVSDGLIAYYSALASSALAQYDNIVHLLAPTSDWTASGAACEVLVRQLVRATLPTQYSVDKGYIYGQRVVGDKRVHSPEIDVLIHDAIHFAPLLRIDDFVIVQPAAVRGLIQVKRTLTSETLKLAIKNLINAKKHLGDCLSKIPNRLNFHPLENVFSAFLTFRDEVQDPADGRISETYKSHIKKAFQGFHDGYVMPHVYGSLSKRVFRFTGLNRLRMAYVAHRSFHNSGTNQDQRNLGLQVFLAMMTQEILRSGMRPPFAFPEDYEAEDHFIVFKKTGE